MKLFFFLLTILSLTFSTDPSYPDAGEVTFYGTYTSTCPAYVCSTQGIKTGCVTLSGSQMLMEGCLDDWYCNWSSSTYSSNQYQYGTCTLKQYSSQFRKNIGDFCYQDSDCKSQYCNANGCAVKAVGAACTASVQCTKGAFCDSVNDVCTSWYQDGASCREHPTLCKPTSGCVSIGNADPVCTALYSVTSGSYVTSVYYGVFSSNRVDYCSTGSITSSGACAASSNTLSGGYPKTCSYSNECTASGDSVYSSCVCWPNTAGVKYCVPFAGDIPDVLASKKSRYLRDFSTCYNHDIGYGWNDCGAYDMNDNRDWAPQIKSNTWGSCYDSVGLNVMTSVYTSYYSSSYSCPTLQCNTANNEDGDCLHYVEGSNTFYVQSCPTDYVCGSNYTGDYSSVYSSDVPCTYGRYRSRKAHKGEWCWTDDDCFSRSCDITKVCTVKTLGASCDSSYECDRGLVCAYLSSSSSSTCQSWIEVNGACTSDNYYLCRPTTKCIATTLGATSGTCRAYYSMATGETGYPMSSGGSYQSGSDYYCESGSYDSLSNTCFSSSSKLTTYPQTCSYNSDCKTNNYQSGNSEYTSCKCFPNTQGQKYCSVTVANIDSSYYSDVKNYASRDLSNCFYYEIGNNYGGDCSFGERYHDIWSASVPSQYFPSCGKDVLYSESRFNEYEYSNSIYLYTFSSRLLSFVCLLLGILLFK